MNLFDKQSTEFARRHIGPDAQETREMLQFLGISGMDELINNTIPASIRDNRDLDLPTPVSEFEYLEALREIADQNKVFRSYIGQGYYDTITPSVILRNLFQNPGWYTQYTPYQAEIAQGRLESLLNFQTMVSDLTGLPIANASLLDEATAAAEAMAMLFNQKNKDHENITAGKFFVDENVFPQTLHVLRTRAKPLGIEIMAGTFTEATLNTEYFGALVQYPDRKGAIHDYRGFITTCHALNVPVIMAADILSLTLITPPGELGADVAIGSTQRMGVPMGYGGPHAAYFATREAYKRNIPGRIIGISKDAYDNRALRMALQTREQHIRREKATSNICTAQALLANMAAMYAVYHGPEGLKSIAKRIALLTKTLSEALSENGIKVVHQYFFDTITIEHPHPGKVKELSLQQEMNFYYSSENQISISLDETTHPDDVRDIVAVITDAADKKMSKADGIKIAPSTGIPDALERSTPFMEAEVFNSHHSETEMMRYLKKLENKDLSLTQSMISLGSCTMKLNAATELIPVSWPEFSRMHPFAPEGQTKGYAQIIDGLGKYLSEITGLPGCSLQPNSGAQGEFAGLLAIKKYHEHTGEQHRDVILIPISAHGTNPASAIMAGCRVVVTQCDERGNIEIEDLREKAEKYKDVLAGLMVTYPSTHGVFEEGIKEMCNIVHDNGGLVYMDGANMNAQAGYTSPGYIGADVCHLNLHKTFAIPHGGGGPGVGPICVNEKLLPFLPGANEEGQVSAAPYGSASILLISYAYIRMLGNTGLKKVTEYAILNANYMKARLKEHFKILYTGAGGACAHEFIVDLRPFKSAAGIEAEDVAKRLMDYGFHAPTLSFPVPGTIMVEPTESENKMELDRFCDALINISKEMNAIAEGRADANDNVLKNAPHTLRVITADEWGKSYSRSEAAFPLEWIHEAKFWPAVARVNNTYGDRNLVCTCAPVEEYV